MIYLSVVDEANINKLPENDVPECIWSTMEILTDVADAEVEQTQWNREHSHEC